MVDQSVVGLYALAKPVIWVFVFLGIIIPANLVSKNRKFIKLISLNLIVILFAIVAIIFMYIYSHRNSFVIVMNNSLLDGLTLIFWWVMLIMFFSIFIHFHRSLVGINLPFSKWLILEDVLVLFYLMLLAYVSLWAKILILAILLAFIVYGGSLNESSHKIKILLLVKLIVIVTYYFNSFFGV